MGFAIASWGGLTLCVALAAAFTVRARRQGALPALIVVAALTLLGGSVTILLATLHAATIVGLRVTAWQRSGSFGWDFRLYSLLLLAGVLGAAGLSLVRHAPGLARGNVMARRGAIGAALALLIVNAPLAPLQGFAIGLAVLAVILLGLLIAIRRAFRATPESD